MPAAGLRYADRMRCRPAARLLLCTLVLACGCEPPQVGSPGLEPPRPREPEAGDGGAEQMTPDTTGGGGHGGAGAHPTPGGAAGSGPTVPAPGMSASDAGSGQAADAAAPDPGGDGGEPRADNPLFVGWWVVEQPTHALYEATLYELLPEGELVEHDTYLLGGEPYEGYVTGTVANADSSVRCDFRGPWTSDGARGLQLGSECTDGQERTVQLAFPEGDATTGLIPTVESVGGEDGGEDGWAHRDFDWSWRKCANRDDCVPF